MRHLTTAIHDCQCGFDVRTWTSLEMSSCGHTDQEDYSCQAASGSSCTTSQITDLASLLDLTLRSSFAPVRQMWSKHRKGRCEINARACLLFIHRHFSGNGLHIRDARLIPVDLQRRIDGSCDVDSLWLMETLKSGGPSCWPWDNHTMWDSSLGLQSLVASTTTPHGTYRIRLHNTLDDSECSKIIRP